MISNRKYLIRKEISGLSVPLDNFVSEWNQCWLDPHRDTSLLFSYLHPVILEWVRMLQDTAYPKNIAYMTLLSRLESSNKIGLLRSWGSQSDIYQELALSYMRLLREISTTLLGKPFEIVYMFTRAHVLLLTHIVRSYKRAHKRWYTVYDSTYPEYPIETNRYINDILLDLRDSPYDTYLMMIYLSGLEYGSETNREIRRMLNAYKVRSSG